MSDPMAVGLSVRERNKQDKLRRIKLAARELFIEKGFHEATTRGIAQRADVGFGTLFRYASDKRDLLFLIYNDDFDELADTAFAGRTEDAPLIDQLMQIFTNFYEFFAARPELARDLLREVSFFQGGEQADRFNGGVLRIERQFVDMISKMQQQGRIVQGEEPEAVFGVLWSIYRAQIREWLRQPDPDLDEGLETLRLYLRLVIEGLVPNPDLP